ncbi:MAG: hypothetical protein AAGB23_05965 [Pseudomonadota bacterium]
MKLKSASITASAFAALVAFPSYAQNSGDEQLEASCRATEVTMPDSCPCTITKSRQAGIDDNELASLFKDDGHSQPVDQGKYSRFWQVKSQCMADSMMASLGVSSGNPLPGVPEHMRPQLPGAAPAPSSAAPTPASPAPARSTAPASATPRAAAPASAPAVPQSVAPTSSAGALSAIASTTTVKTNSAGIEVVDTKYTLQGSDYYFGYEKALEALPGVVELARERVNEDLTTLLEYDGPSGRSYRDEQHTYWQSGTKVGRLTPLIASGYTNNRPAGQFLYAGLYDTELNREISWSDVFGSSAWNGQIREHWCAGLSAERFAKDTWEYNTTCPDFDRIIIDFEKQDDGSLHLSFSALNGEAGSYAEGPYLVEVPLTAKLLSAIRPTYRGAFSGFAPSEKQPLIQRAGRQHYPAPHYYDRDTVNLDFDYSWNGAQVSSYSGLSWALRERAEEDFQTMTKRADAMVADGKRAPISFRGLWAMGDPVGKRIISVKFLETFEDAGAPKMLPEREGDYIFWDQTDDEEVTLKDIFPSDWNTTIPASLCRSLNETMANNAKPSVTSCPDIEETQISFMVGMDGDHFIMFKLLGEYSDLILGSVTVPVTRELKARANAKYRDDFVAY